MRYAVRRRSTASSSINLLVRQGPLSSLFPYTTLFRSGLLRGVFHSVGDDEVQSGFLQDSLAFFDVCAFEPDDDRSCDFEVAGRLDRAAVSRQRLEYQL